MPLFTLEMLRGVFSDIKDSETSKINKLQAMVNELNRIHTDGKPMYVYYKLDTRTRIEHFFAQCYVEVGSSFRLEEGLGYTTAERLKQVFPNKFKGDNAKKADELIALQSDKAKAIANYVYGDRNGNQGGDDGWNFRGRGIIQLTGKNNYTAFQDYYNNSNPNDKKDFLNNENHRNEITANGKFALLSAVYFWNARTYPGQGVIAAWRGKYLYQIANDKDNGDIMTKEKDSDSKQEIELTQTQRVMSKLINGGYNGLTNRRDAHNRIKNAKLFKDFK